MDLKLEDLGIKGFRGKEVWEFYILGVRDS